MASSEALTRGLALLLVFCGLFVAVGGQALSGEVLSVVQVPSCSLLPRDDLATLYESEENSGATDGTDGTKCGVLGEETPVTTVTIALQANQVASQDDLVFTITRPDSTDGNQYFKTPLVLTFSTSDIVEVYQLKRNMNPIAYGTYWVASADVDLGDFGLQGNGKSYFTQYLSQTTATADVLANLPSPFTVVDNSASVGRTGIKSVCPSPIQLGSATSAGQLTQDELEYFPNFPTFTDEATGQYRTLTTDPLLLFCPVLGEQGQEVESMTAGYIEQIVTYSTLWDIVEVPRTMANVIVKAGIRTTNSTTGQLNDDIQPITQLNLSTLQNGADIVDPLGLIVGAMINVQTNGPLGQPMSGSIVETAACVHDSGDPSQDPSCRNGARTDYAQPVASGDFDFAYTKIPWRDSEALNQRCPVPSQKCSQLLFGDDAVRSEWTYIKPQARAVGYGSGCSKNGQRADFYAYEPAAAELTCAAGRNFTCAAGYQQSVGRLAPAVTPCETDVDIALLCKQYAVDGVDVSFSGVMPGDFNPTQPQYAKDAGRFIKAVDGQASISYIVTLTLSADYVGEIVTEAAGVIVASGMICGTPDNSGAGLVRVLVSNPETTLAGSYTADATFSDSTAASTGSYEVTGVSPCTISLEPRTSGACDISFSYSGPIDLALVASVTLYSGVVAAGSGQAELATAEVQCVISAEITSGGTFGSASLHTLLNQHGDRLPDPDDADCPAYYFCVLCTPQSTEGYLWCAVFWFTFAAAVLLFITGTAFFIIGDIQLLQVLRAQSKAVKYLKKTASGGMAAAALPAYASARLLYSGESVHGHHGAFYYNWTAEQVTMTATLLATFVSIACIFLWSVTNRKKSIWTLCRAAMAYAIASTPMALMYLFQKIRYTAALYDFTAVPVPLRECVYDFVRYKIPSNYIYFVMMIGLLGPKPVVSQGLITGVTSYAEFVLITDPNGNTLTPAEGGIVTTVEMELSTAVQGGLTSFSYTEDFSVVPTDDPADAAGTQTSGTLCASLKNATCQSTTRATVEVTIDQAVLVSTLKSVEGFLGGYSALPYSYFYNWITEVVQTDDAGVRSVADLLESDGTIRGGTCSLFTSAGIGADTPFPYTADLNRLFNDTKANADYLRCPPGAEPPSGPFNPSSPGALQYLFVCEHTCVIPDDDDSSSNQCNTVLEIAANFQPTQPVCPVFVIDSVPKLTADVTMRIFSAELGINETATVSSYATSLQGATAVSTPGNLAAIEIFGVSGGGGGLGPSLGEMVYLCTSDGSPLNMVPEGTPQGASPVPSSSLSFNPYRALGLAYDDDYEQDDVPDAAMGTCQVGGGTPYVTNKMMPEPCTNELLTGIPDPYAQMLIFNSSMAVRIGSQAGQWGVDPNLYSRNSPELLFTTGINSVNVPMSSIVPASQGGTGNFASFDTGVPPFGRGFVDLPPITAAIGMADMRAYQNSMDPPSGARAPPFMPASYKNYNRVPNIWARIPPGGGTPLLLMEPSDRSYLIRATITTTQGAIAYRSRVPNGGFDASRTSCIVYDAEDVSTDGSVNYQVCNTNAEGLRANYRLTITCGAQSTFNAVLGDFDPTAPPTARMQPASLLLTNVAPGECRNPITSGDVFFEVLYPLDDIINGTDPLRCVFDLTSEDTVVPSQMGLEKTSVQCGISLPLAAASNRTDAPYGYYAPLDYRDPLDIPYRYLYEGDGGDELRDLGTAGVITLSAGGIIFLCCVIGSAVAACVICCRERSLSKQLKNPQKVVYDVKQKQQ